MSTETSCYFGHLLQLSKKSLWRLILYYFFHDFIHVYSPGTGADNPLGTKFWCQQENLDTSVICCKFKKISLKSDFIQFFMILYMNSPGAGADNPWGRNFDVNRKILTLRSFVASLKKSLWILILYNFFMILYMYIGQDRDRQLPGDKVLMSTEMSCHFIQLLQALKNVFEVWFYTMFSWLNTCI